MSTVHKPPSRTRQPGAASFRYGYRYVRKKLPNGRVGFDRVPLTLEDVLHPQFGDVHVLSSAHSLDCRYTHDVLDAWLADDPSAAVLSDVGVFWDEPELEHHSPDITVILGVQRRQDWSSFHVKTEGVRPVLIVEVTSPATRVNDVKTKVEEYAQARVPFYVIADARGRGKKRRLKLISYRLERGAYKPVELDEQGRAWLEPVRLWLGTAVNPETGGDRLVLIDPATGEEIGNYTAISRALAAAAQSKRESEARIRELEAEVRRLRGQASR
ncbi:MAG: Uma2 family endonuclease [Isosphaerales bacterium]